MTSTVGLINVIGALYQLILLGIALSVSLGLGVTRHQLSQREKQVSFGKRILCGLDFAY